RYATHIDLLVRGPKMRASEVLQKDLANHSDKIKVHFNTTTDKILGQDNKVVAVEGAENGDKKVRFETDGVFIFIGLKPNTGFLDGSGIELDEIGLVKTDEELHTNIPGIFCAGDVRSGATMQIASAAGEGATAALNIRKYLEELERKEA
ncbi:MAG TPA: NAD(P)/FAD-dependent oxidoreductase, partial [Patescibacteria group bacterium]|nr:NAD(P)/FAD-dependent oxidoreductase [Patescibacteria group bacterium]